MCSKCLCKSLRLGNFLIFFPIYFRQISGRSIHATGAAPSLIVSLHLVKSRITIDKYIYGEFIVRTQKEPIHTKPEGRTRCTLIPGDGVGPEVVYSLQEIFKAANCPIDFDPFFFSEINPTMSASLEDVTASIKKNKVAIKVCSDVLIQICGMNC